MAILLRTEPARIPPVVHRAFSGTPRRLIVIGAGLVAAVAVFIMVLISGMSDARAGISTLSARAAEANATNDLYVLLNDMDAQAANALLVGFHPTMSVPPSASAAAAMAAYESDRANADADLQRIGLNPALATRDKNLLDALGSYEALIGQAVYIDQNTQNEAPAAPPTAALVLYQSATTAMHGSILPDAAAIRDQDYRGIDGQYTGDHDSTIAYTVAIAVLGVVLLVVLIGANQYLSRRFRRIVGPALALAAVTVIAVTAVGATALGHTAHEYKVAKLNAFDSISALTTAKALSYDANADESRWLLNRYGDFQDAFFADADQIAHVSGVNAAAASVNPGTYSNGLAAAVTRLSVGPGANTVSGVTLGGLLGNELNNITFDQEAYGAFNTALGFDKYILDDATIRDDANRGDMAAAVTYDISANPGGGSNFDFNLYIAKLQGVIDLNQNAFNAAVSDGRGSLAAWTWLPYGVGALLLALVAVALYPRLREYR